MYNPQLKIQKFQILNYTQLYTLSFDHSSYTLNIIGRRCTVIDGVFDISKRIAQVGTKSEGEPYRSSVIT